jgi:hypothetical protein
MARTRFQFSIRMLMAAVAVIGMSLAAVVTEPGWASGALLLFMLTTIPAAALAGVVNGRGSFRAFCIGVLVPSSFGVWLVGTYVLNWHWQTLASGQIAHFLEYAKTLPYYASSGTVLWSLALATGLACVIFHWLFIDKAPEDG